MNIIQTLYVNKGKNLYTDSFGWVNPAYHLMSWALSCLQLKKFYSKLTLYANEEAVNVLIDDLKLPYDVICTSHNNLELQHPQLWALPKIYTYSLQSEPYLHVDGDVYIFQPFGNELMNNEVIVQNMEIATEYYTSTQRVLMKCFSYFPNVIRSDFWSDKPIQAVNAGILGGNNLSFLNEYANMSLEYVERNKQHFNQINVDKFNVFFEQHLFYALAKEREIKIGTLFRNVFTDRGYKYIGNLHETPSMRSYIHLLGHFKRDEFTCIQMATKLRQLYPEYFYRILSLYKKKNLIIGSFPFSKFEVTIDLSCLDNAYQLNIQNIEQKIDKNDLKQEYEKFRKSVASHLRTIQNYDCLLQRDLDAASWYTTVFCTTKIEFVQLVKVEGYAIIESKYDWAGMLNANEREGVEYYEAWTLQKDAFYNLLIPEYSYRGFSLYDIDDFDVHIISYLTKPMSIGSLCIELENLAEQNVIENHLEEYHEMIFEYLKRLILLKVIKPI